MKNVRDCVEDLALSLVCMLRITATEAAATLAVLTRILSCALDRKGNLRNPDRPAPP
ncbi:unnamed protein product [Schistosoma mattheei]|uniref:Uncharacterized protein n=1 Tax=Schistosoma mattheei TaxID=31246 RepID=A0A3P8KQB7_9TREM|nr:unnamed protein product [Schistosoma mattheei]